MRSTYLYLLLILSTTLSAQTIADFESFNLPIDTFLNGSDGSGGFSDGPVLLPNDYNTEWQSWSGWAISSITDNTTPGFMNQYSAITGGGAEESNTYAVTYAAGGSILHLQETAMGHPIQNIAITNSTYAYLSMKDGDAFAKKFGGVTGNDADYLLLTIKSFYQGALSADSINVYLADFRFEDNTQDYILEEWTAVDLQSLGNVDSLLFSLSSTDVGQFGMNTPAYFCIDNLTASDGMTTSVNQLASSTIKVFPNPTTDFITIQNLPSNNTQLSIMDMQGRVLIQRIVVDFDLIDVSFLPVGIYALRLFDGVEIKQSLLIKK